MRKVLAIGFLSLFAACSGGGGQVENADQKPPVPTAVSTNLVVQGECAKAMAVESMAWGEEYGHHPEVRLRYAGEKEVANLYLYFEVYDAAGAKTDDLLAETTGIRPGDALTLRCRFVETGKEAKCELVRVLTIP